VGNGTAIIRVALFSPMAVGYAFAVDMFILANLFDAAEFGPW
jgi:hypothetical protein